MQDCEDLVQLVIKASRVEQFIHDKSSKNPKTISMVVDEEEDSSKDDLAVEQMEAKLLKGKPYPYHALRPSKGKETVEKGSYLFDISIVDKIFGHQVKDQQTRHPNGQEIPSPEELKNGIL